MLVVTVHYTLYITNFVSCQSSVEYTDLQESPIHPHLLLFYTLYTEYSTLYTEYSTLYTDYSTLNTEYSTLNTEYSSLYTEYSTLYT